MPDPAPPPSRDRERAVTRLGIALSDALAELAECGRALAELVRARTRRAWTDEEHGSYLRLRYRHTAMLQRIAGMQRTFDRARDELQMAQITRAQPSRAAAPSDLERQRRARENGP